MRLKSYRRIVDFQKIAAKKGLVPRAAKKPIGEQKYSTNSQNTIFFVFGPKLCIWERERSKNTKKQIFLQNVFGNMIFGSKVNKTYATYQKRKPPPKFQKKSLSSQNTYVHAFSYLFETDPLFKKRILYCVFWVTLSRRIGDSESWRRPQKKIRRWGNGLDAGPPQMLLRSSSL